MPRLSRFQDTPNAVLLIKEEEQEQATPIIVQPPTEQESDTEDDIIRSTYNLGSLTFTKSQESSILKRIEAYLEHIYGEVFTLPNNKSSIHTLKHLTLLEKKILFLVYIKDIQLENLSGVFMLSEQALEKIFLDTNDEFM